MKMNLKLTALSVALLLNFSACSTAGTKDCVSCAKKGFAETEPDKTEALRLKSDLSAPMAMATKGSLMITKSNERTPADDSTSTSLTQSDYQDIFCHKFAQIEQQSLVSLIADQMEKTPYPIDDYFKTPTCQPDGYSDAVKSPIPHIVADDPSKRVQFLDILWLYYSKKRKDPSRFTDLVNAKNTKGETLLDYFESQRLHDNYNAGLQANADKIIAMICTHGAVYSAYPNKKCP
jgi:hypothetical protein